MKRSDEWRDTEMGQKRTKEPEYETDIRYKDTSKDTETSDRYWSNLKRKQLLKLRWKGRNEECELINVKGRPDEYERKMNPKGQKADKKA